MGRDAAGKGEVAGVAAHVLDGSRYQDTGRGVALVSSFLHSTSIIVVYCRGNLLQTLKRLEFLLDDIVLAEEDLVHLDLVESVLA